MQLPEPFSPGTPSLCSAPPLSTLAARDSLQSLCWPSPSPPRGVFPDTRCLQPHCREQPPLLHRAAHKSCCSPQGSNYSSRVSTRFPKQVSVWVHGKKRSCSHYKYFVPNAFWILIKHCKSEYTAPCMYTQFHVNAIRGRLQEGNGFSHLTDFMEIEMNAVLWDYRNWV